MMCNGHVEQGIGCIKYNGSEKHLEDEQHELMMRHCSLGFGITSTADVSMMAAHLQGAHGLSFEETNKVLS